MSLLLSVCACAVLLALTARAQPPPTTPVPILNQINRQNDDGSYSFGYEAADGSFKIETKYANGDVAGKYGYRDDSGQLREISYGASSQRGFEPQGDGIVVPPLPAPSAPPARLAPGQEDDGQYREDPSVYEHVTSAPASAPRPPAAFPLAGAAAPERRPFPQPAFRQQSTFQQAFQRYQPRFPTQYQPQLQQPQYQQPQYEQPQYQQPQYQQPQYQQPQYQQPQYQQSQPQPQYKPQAQYQSTPAFDLFAGHPAHYFDPHSGSYSISYSG